MDIGCKQHTHHAWSWPNTNNPFQLSNKNSKIHRWISNWTMYPTHSSYNFLTAQCSKVFFSLLDMIHIWFISQTFPQFFNKMGSFPVKTDICLHMSKRTKIVFICKSYLTWAPYIATVMAIATLAILIWL